MPTGTADVRYATGESHVVGFACCPGRDLCGVGCAKETGAALQGKSHPDVERGFMRE
jgi:hypothetical protein